jgi:hypothetical protein
MVDCKGSLSSAVTLGAISTSVAGALLPRGKAGRGGLDESYGAERTEPSIRQKANVSSGYVRLQVGQLFILIE